MEICYELYSPRIQKIEVLKLEKRLDDNLMYLRDALPEYSTVDPGMKPALFSPTGEVPVNKVRKDLDQVWHLQTFAFYLILINCLGICLHPPDQSKDASQTVV